jgi:hypothetical protein
VNSSGTDLAALKDRSQVHGKFGIPVASGVIDGHEYEDFRSHRKIAEYWNGEYFIMGYWATLGFGEFIWLPTELYEAGRQIIVGQDIRFIYSTDGTVLEVFVNGEKDRWSGYRGIALSQETMSPDPTVPLSPIGGRQKIPVDQ